MRGYRARAKRAKIERERVLFQRGAEHMRSAAIARFATIGRSEMTGYTAAEIMRGL